MEWQQFDHLVNVIKNEDNKRNNNKKLLRLCSMILENFKADEDLLNDVDKETLIDLFVEFQNICKHANSFFESGFNHLDIKLQEGKYGAKIKKLQEQIVVNKERIDNITELNKELLDKENEYIEKNKRLIDLKDRINNINEIKLKATPEYINNLNEKVKNLETEIGSTKEHLDNLENNNKILELKKKELSEIVNGLENRSSKTNEEIKQLIELLHSFMSDDWSKLDDELFRKKDSYNKTFNSYNRTFEQLNTVLSQIEEVEEIHLSNIEEYKLHFENNNSLWISLKDVNYINNEKLKQQIERILDDKLPQITKQLEEMDQMLRELIQLNQQSRSKIRRANKIE